MHVKLQKYIEGLQESSRFTFSREGAIRALGCSEKAFEQAVLRLIKKNVVMSPRRGFFVVIPAEYRRIGGPSADWFIDSLMKHYKRPYYVGILSAAALHGAAHQAPQEMQVVTSASLRPIEVGRNRIRFLMKKNLRKTATQRMNTRTGTMVVSTPESTAFDLIRYFHAAGGVNNVATVLKDLSEVLKAKKLVSAAKACGEMALVQRLGHIMDVVGHDKKTVDLYQWLEKQPIRWVQLEPGIEGKKKDKKWLVKMIEEVDPD